MENEQADAGQDGTAEPEVSRDKLLGANGDREIFVFPCLADQYEQDWQSYPVDQYSAMCDDHVLADQYEQDWQSYPVDQYSMCDDHVCEVPNTIQYPALALYYIITIISYYYADQKM